MHTYDAIVAIHRARKMGDKTKSGLGRLDQFGAAAGAPGLSTRPEGPTLADRLLDSWGVSYVVRGRKAAKTELPDGVEPGEYKTGSIAPDGLHSAAYKASDGTGSAVYCYTRKAQLLDPGEDHGAAIGQTIHSDVILLVSRVDGKRHEVETRTLVISDLYGGRTPDNWTWSR